MANLTLIRNGEVFSPQPLGRQDLLLAGGRIAAMAAPGTLRLTGLESNVVEARDRWLVPGFIDSHVHILGGGGEGGPTTRAPEIRIEAIAAAGVTTLIGCLGTDGVTRHMESLLAKARALDSEGVSTYIFSGSYEIPVRTITGSVRSDLVLIDKVVGAGEIAISDHRSAQPTFAELARLAAECRVGGMLGGKAGILHLHVGDGAAGLSFLFRLIEETEIPVTQVIPTHCNRNRRLFAEAQRFVQAGGYMDLTAGIGSDPAASDEVGIDEAVRDCLEKGVPLERITVSSDGNGSIPVFDAQGRLLGLTIATQVDLLGKFRSLLRLGIVGPEQALRLFSSNVATFYKLDAKGEIAPGRDADLLLLDRELNLCELFARGRRLVAEGRVVVRGTFSGSGNHA